MNKLNIPICPSVDINLYMKYYNQGQITCQCGSIIAKSGQYAHKKTKKHKLLMTLKNLSDLK